MCLKLRVYFLFMKIVSLWYVLLLWVGVKEKKIDLDIKSYIFFLRFREVKKIINLVYKNGLIL